MARWGIERESEGGAKPLAIALWSVCVLLVLGTLWSVFANPARTSRGAAVAATLGVLSFPTVGALIATRRPRNPIGWLYLTTGLTFGLGIWAWEFGWWAVATGSGLAEDVTLLIALTGGWWALALGTIAPYSLLLFPDGHPPSRRWRAVLWVAGIGVGLLLLALPFSPDNSLEIPGVPSNPLAVALLRGVAAPIVGIGAIMFFPTIPVSIVGLILRLRRSSGLERAQLKWFVFGGAVFTLAVVVGIVLDARGHEAARENLLGVAMLFVPICAGIAMLRHRLYDIDVVIKKTVIFLILVVLLTAIFLVGALAIGGLLADTGVVDRDTATIVLAFAIGALIAPLWRLSRAIAERVVYGGRASAYEVLTGFSSRMRETYDTEDVLARMATVLGSGTGAQTATVWLRVGDALRAEATWPSDADPPTDVPADAVAIVHQGEELGALSVGMPANDPLDDGRRQLTDDLAAQAGPVLRNVRLIEELRGSRRRIVAAQDEERRRIERNIHDGAQQQLVALSVKARLARQLAERDAAKTAEMLEQIERETQTALEDLRDLARGIYPPLLADQGLPAALEAQARRATIPVTLEADGIGRFDQDLEAAVYFCTLEALQNVAKYANATSATVRLSNGAGELVFEVTDDGVGFDPGSTGYGTGLRGMADRLAAIGGELVVQSAAGEGTTVRGRLPAEVRA